MGGGGGGGVQNNARIHAWGSLIKCVGIPKFLECKCSCDTEKH